MKEITDADFVRALNAVAATVDGQIVLAMLKDHCQWDKTYIASDNPTISHYYAVKRGVYGGLRDRIRPEHLKKIEFEYKRKVGNNNVRESGPGAAGTASGNTERPRIAKRKQPA